MKTGLKNNADVTCSKLMYLNKPGIINNAGSTLKPNSDWPIIEIGINEKDGDKYSKDYEISAFCGACVLVKRSFFKDVGLFDSKFFLYFEDGDLSWRGQKAKKKYYFSAKALAYHHHSGSTTEHSDLFNFFVARNRILILTKNASYKVLFKVWIKTIRDHFLFRTKRLYLALMGRYSKKLALKESYNGFKIIFAALIYTPYALCKRYNIIKEEYL